MTTGLVGKPPRAARQVVRSSGPAGWPDGWTGFCWGVAVAAGRAAPAARRWQTGLGSALSGGPVPTRRARSATEAAAGRLAHQPGRQPADYRPPGGVPLVGRSHRDRRAPTLRGAVGPDRHPRAIIVPGLLTGFASSATGAKAQRMPIDPSMLAKSIGTLNDLDPTRDLPATLHQA